MYETVLLPVAPEGGTMRAIPHVATLADRYDATVHVISVVDSVEEMINDPRVEMLADRLQTTAHDRVHEVSEALLDINADLEIVTHVERGTAHGAILSMIDEVDADVVVMPTHTRQGLERVLLGSITERVIRESPVPVVSIPMEEDAPGD
ncbi:universal stress protein [Halopenitus sp. H-Gu1]|uniref:universal stress protein n=1 Tax=Halopenitus sp. H-Gu1 TaxID=3242697 RepID=UPI00359DCAEE